MTLENSAVSEEKRTVVVEPLLFRRKEELADAALAHEFTTTTLEESGPGLEERLRDAYECGKRDAQAAIEAECKQLIEEERASLLRVTQQFQQEKQNYFTQVEVEVVRLSLAIAERVLHREAEMDPMLLASAVRVALEQIADTSETILHVPVQEATRWMETLRSVSRDVQIEPDEHLAQGEAVLKARCGSVQLGIKAQLQEIERGFFELLGRRPPMAV